MRNKLLAAMPGLKERAKAVIELIESAYFIFAPRPLSLDEKALSLLDNGGKREAGKCG